MNMALLVRPPIGFAAAAGPVAVAVATIVATAAPASAEGVTISASTAYCVGSTYTLTLPAADATILIGNVPWQNAFAFQTRATGDSAFNIVATAPYVAGKDVVATWTPTAAGEFMTSAWPYSTDRGLSNFGENGPTVTVVQTAPAGATCTPPTAGNGGTGSASSIPVIGGLLSSLSAQK
ncbi:hypothetical protein ACFV4K_33160 [Nocardia sp. NPDC059764]|uniref:hypothetical protein n=1 Tax=Nocardia sp. NPDC059764 TaxID=3346939 RepID=UPI0036595590